MVPVISGITKTSMALTWAAPVFSGALIGYEISMQADRVGPFSVYLANTGSTSVSANITGLIPHTVYSFKVAAVSAFEIGPQSPPSLPAMTLSTNAFAFASCGANRFF